MEQTYELQTHGVEEEHWWYRGRRRIVRAVLSRLCPPPSAQILDAGCGSGRNMVDLSVYGQVTGVELSPAAVRAARERQVGEVVEASLEALPFATATFDLAVCLDVIEHLDRDRLALAELRRVVRPGGYLLVTVPAYQWLWSYHDLLNQHRRRYNRVSLLRVCRAAGWEPLRATYFNSFLLPLAIAARLSGRLYRRPGGRSRDLWLPPAPLNRALEAPLRLEAALLSREAVTLPLGLSLLAVMR